MSQKGYFWTFVCTTCLHITSEFVHFPKSVCSIHSLKTVKCTVIRSLPAILLSLWMKGKLTLYVVKYSKCGVMCVPVVKSPSGVVPGYHHPWKASCPNRKFINRLTRPNCCILLYLLLYRLFCIIWKSNLTMFCLHFCFIVAFLYIQIQNEIQMMVFAFLYFLELTCKLESLWYRVSQFPCSSRLF